MNTAIASQRAHAALRRKEEIARRLSRTRAFPPAEFLVVLDKLDRGNVIPQSLWEDCAATIAAFAAATNRSLDFEAGQWIPIFEACVRQQGRLPLAEIVTCVEEYKQ